MSMYHNNYNHNKNNDTNSFGSSVDTPDPEIPEDMTEEKAMEIWLRKDDEIRARMIREEEMAAERAAAEPNQEAVLGEQLYHQQLQQQPNNNNNEGGIAAPAHHHQHQSTNSEYDMSYDSDSCGDSNLPLAIPAAQSNSAAWQDAISHNPIDPNDPAQHETWLAYERFIQLNKPGVADNYVPSTPGLARLIEEQREEERRALVRKTEQQQQARAAAAAAAAAEVQEQQSTSSPSSTSLRREEYVNQQILRMQQQHQCQWDNNNYASNSSAYGAQHHQQQIAHQMNTSSMSSSQGLYTSHAAQGTQARGGALPPLVDMDDDVYRRYHQEQQQQTIPSAFDPQDPLILAQARELERLSQEHRSARSLNDGRGNTTAYPPPSRNINSFDVVGTPSTPPLDDLKPAALKKKDDSSLSSESFYLATPQCTQYNTQPVICSHCQALLHTHPLALNYFCQQCCRVTRKVEGSAEYQQGQVAQKSEWGESKYEEKMMESEDYFDQDDMMGIGSWASSR